MFQNNKKYLLDGGSGQTLLEMGLKTTGDLWSAKALIDNNNHHLVLKMHQDFINAGSELIVTANFSVRKRMFIKHNILDYFEESLRSAGEIALKAKNKSNKHILVAGSMPNQGNTYSPLKFETDETIYNNFLEIAQILNQYVDIFYLDVLSSINEIKLALEATKNFNKQILVGVHLRYDAKLPSGETLNELFKVIRNYNCCGIISACISPEIVNLSLPFLAKQSLPFGYKVNLFKEMPTGNIKTFTEEGFDGEREYIDPADLLGSRIDEYNNDKIKQFVIKTLGKNVSLIGGCCEIKPRHINLLKNLF